MRAKDWQHYKAREPFPGHDEEIRPHPDAFELMFRSLCTRIFDVHLLSGPALHAPPTPSAEDVQQQVLPEAVRTYCSWKFHEEYYSRPTSLSLTFSRSYPIPVADFSRLLTADCQPGSANNVFFLTGSIGTGKSTFISNLIHHNAAEWLKQRVLPLRVDMDSGPRTEHGLPSKRGEKYELLFPVYDALHKAYLDAGLIGKEERDLCTSEAPFPRNNSECVDSQTYKLEAGLRDLYNNLYAMSGNHRVLLVLDNMDFLYHVYDRGLFIREADAPYVELDANAQQRLDERERAHKIVQYLVRSFAVNNTALRNFGANVLIVLRRDSMRHFRSGAPDIGAQIPDLTDRCFDLEKPDDDDVLRAHSDLLRHMVSFYRSDTIKQRLQRVLNTIHPQEGAQDRTETQKRQLAIGRMLHRHLCGLSRQGLRHVMRHYGDYVWLPAQHTDAAAEEYADELTERFTRQLSPSLIAFIQSGRKLFSQFNSRFPNIYLVRGDYPEERNEVWAPLCGPHKPTFWLKRLICQVVADMKGEKSPRAIYRMFSGTEDGRDETLDGFYDDRIVRLCLGSLSQVEKCHALDFEFFPKNQNEPHAHVQSIALSSRGQYLFDKGEAEAPFVDSFTYLQLISDDYVLPLPKCMFPKFEYVDGMDYGYLAAHDYGDRVIKMLKAKIPVVFHLIDILRVSLEWEKKAFKNAFARIKDEPEITVPSVDAIEDQVKGDLQRLQDALNRRARTTFSYESKMPSADERNTNRKALADMFRQVYELPQEAAEEDLS